jgi:hypothetical protein
LVVFFPGGWPSPVSPTIISTLRESRVDHIAIEAYRRRLAFLKIFF